MSSSAPLPHPSVPDAPSFWSRQSAPLKLGLKTGLAGIITYAIYAGFHLHQGYWAVFTALIVTQANVGASWKAALYRTIGTTAGALAAALLVPMLGTGPVGVGIVLFVLATFFAYVAVLHPAFTTAGFTAAIILVFGGLAEPWHTAWLRVLYTVEGAFAAFIIGALLWPVRAREALREKIADILKGGGELYHAVTVAALEGANNEEQIRQLDRELHDLRRGITQQMDEARSELAFSRFNQSAYEHVIDLGDQIRRRLTAMAEDSSLYANARIEPDFLPALPLLAERTARGFASLADTVQNPSTPLDSGGLDDALRDLDSDLAKLRAERATAPLTLDRMLPFWALVFNLKEIAQDLKQLQAALPQLL